MATSASIEAFLEHACKRNGRARTDVPDFRQCCARWARRNGWGAPSDRLISATLARHGILPASRHPDTLVWRYHGVHISPKPPRLPGMYRTIIFQDGSEGLAFRRHTGRLYAPDFTYDPPVWLPLTGVKQPHPDPTAIVARVRRSAAPENEVDLFEAYRCPLFELP